MRSNHKATLAALAAVAIGSALATGDLEAQLQHCGFCDSTHATVTCSTSNEPVNLLCTGVFLWTICTGCQIEQAELPARLSPDGSITTPTQDIASDQLMRFGEEIQPGVFVARARCNGTIISRWYTAEAASSVRTAMAVLTL